MDWKLSVALLPVPWGPPLVVSAGGRGEIGGSQTGDYGVCTDSAMAWVGAFDRNGTPVWEKKHCGEGEHPRLPLDRRC